MKHGNGRLKESFSAEVCIHSVRYLIGSTTKVNDFVKVLVY